MPSTTLTATAVAHLRTASVHPDGHLPKVGPRMLRLFVTEKYAYRNDIDGYVLDGQAALEDLNRADDSRPFIITAAGRRAALNRGQIKALTEEIGPDGRLARGVPWPTQQTLARLLLVEFRDEHGNPAPGDGTPFRTGLGTLVAEAAHHTIHPDDVS
ncbi:hypothetical protein KBZ00_17760 [Streptomyces sp. RK31]|uniref:hypothetical protein n=1 Tax=Streptomyces sp. RK31 TaxID=2824892 RepID=UPI001B36CE8A|nr:hypothetical protein [Streptomyces sp. RK31]MBQ0972972.1 hypothetical protein [Streptomyces sp. RK31]